MKPRIFFITNCGYDVDNCGAFALAHVLADKGGAILASVNSSVLDSYAPKTIDNAASTKGILG